MIDASEYQLLCDDVLPLARRIPTSGRYAIALGGSHGKGLSDISSDFDFRTYYETRVDGDEWQSIIKEMYALMDKWRAKGIEIDGVWPRSVQEIDAALDRWLSGQGTAEPLEWAVWGYHVLTDIYNQVIVEDPCGIAQRWKDRLSVYSPTLKSSILARHTSSLKYWRGDYHYRGKVARQDPVFLASLSARLVHDIMQVIYALNHVYFPGDGHNLTYARSLEIRPASLEERVTSILYPGKAPDCYEDQYRELTSLIDEVLGLCR